MPPTEEQGGHELAALRELVGSEGWLILKQRAATEWGPEGYGRRMQAAISSVANGPDRAYELAQIAEQVDATARAVNELISWPAARLGALQQDAPSKQPFARFRRQG